LKENGVVVLNEESVGSDVCAVVVPKLKALVADGNDSDDDEEPNENCDISSNIQRLFIYFYYYFNQLLNIKKISIFFNPNKNSLSIEVKLFFIQFYDVFTESINKLFEIFGAIFISIVLHLSKF
jgi:hypothetical protein